MEDDLVENPETARVYKDIKYEALKVIVETISATSSRLIINEFQKALSNKEMIANVKNNLMPYLYTAGLLSFAAREISEENMSSVLKSIGVEPDPDLVKVIIKAGVKSHLVYIYSFYFLVANGNEPSDANIQGVIRALGLTPDKKRVKETLNFLELQSGK